MKTLQEVVKKRKELEDEVSYHQSKRSKFNSVWAELSDDEKRYVGEILRTIQLLKIQIDALTYVINYDSKLQDVTTTMRMTSNRD